MKDVVARQYRENVNAVREKLAGVQTPSEGWLCTMRKALGMSGSQLARRMDITRGAISNFEKAEREGGVTLKTLQHLASAMNCRLVYAFVPEDDIDAVLMRRARKRANALVKEAGIHMELEDQALTLEKFEQEIDRVTKELLEKRKSELWNDD